MKSISIVTSATLLLLGLTVPTWASTPPAQPAQVQTSPEAASTQAEQLMIHSTETEEPVRDNTEQLDSLARQINQNLSTDGRNHQTRLQDLLNLPKGMIIRGSARGGLSVGAEL